MVRLGSGRYAASGCGRGAVYEQRCDGGDCRWGRLRHGHELTVASSSFAPASAEVTSGGAAAALPSMAAAPPAPAPEPRVIEPAPAPDARTVQPAPAPDVDSTGQQQSPLLVDDAAQAQALDPVPLTADDLSDPYQAQVPAEPVAQQTSQTPPVALVETRPSPPSPTYIWVGGYWWWSTGGWLWVPGYWCPPVVGYTYLPGRWYWSVGYWNYWPGGWALPGSRTVVYRVRARPHRRVYVRRYTPRPRSSRSPGIVRGRPRPATRPSYRAPSSMGRRTVAPAPRPQRPGRVSPGSSAVGRRVSPSTVVSPRSKSSSPLYRRPAPTFSPPARRSSPARPGGSYGVRSSPSRAAPARVRPSPRSMPSHGRASPSRPSHRVRGR